MRPLEGKTVVVTRPAHSATQFVEALTSLGAVVDLLPVTSIAPPDDVAPFVDAVKGLDGFDWVVLTSVNAVDALLRVLQESAVPLAVLQSRKIAAIGPATAAVLRENECPPDVVPQEYVGEGLIRALPDLAGKRVLLPQADNARPFLREALQEGGAVLTCVDAYSTKTADFDIPRGPAPEYLTLTSGTGAKTVLDAARKACRDDWLNDTVAVCIGPVTAQAAVEAGAKRVEVASDHTTVGLVAKIKELEASHARV
ncbi:MAG TPA: uroporphyrinogen-III synthase [Fimbriimonadaceae bacterium]|nr:uroporphyrinogen-III synthase [Fimbriimonadaceae bacterium]